MNTRRSCQYGFRVYSSEWWSIELPEGWSHLEEPECTSFHLNATGGVLRVSAVRKPEGSISKADLMDFFEQRSLGDARPLEVESRHYFGLKCEYEKCDSSWSEWWLARGSILVYITYTTVGPSNRGSELDAIRGIVESLRIVHE